MITIRADINDLQKIPGIKRSLVVIGKFDGLHQYHEKLIKIATKLAVKNYLQLIVLSFDSSFNSLNHQVNDQMMHPKEKESIFEDYFALDYYIELVVNENLQSYSQNQFMGWLKKTLKCQMLVEGSDFTFGTDKQGTVTDLKRYFGDENVYVLNRNSRSLSSTKIRDLLKKGKINQANKLLYTPFKLYVEANNRSTKKVVFPNLELSEGCYEGRVDDKQAATILLTNHTVELLDFDQLKNKKPEFITLVKYLGKTLK